MKKLVALMVALTMVLGLASVASAAEYPSKGISVICPWGAGGGTDAVLRAFCEAMGKDLGVTLTVDNRTGGGGIIGHQAIADAEADGYTIGMITFELSTYKHLGTSELTYEDYEPLCRVNTDAAAITVGAKWAASNNITDLAGFIDYCKSCGYILCAMVLSMIIMILIGKRNWLQMVLVSILVPLGMWLVFYKVLTVNIPMGPLQFLRDLVDMI